MEAKSDRAEGRVGFKFYLEGSREPWQGFETEELHDLYLTKMPLAAAGSRRQSQEKWSSVGRGQGLDRAGVSHRDGEEEGG